MLADDCLLTDRSGLRAQPAAAAHGAGFHAAHAARIADGRERGWRSGGGHHVGRIRERRRALENRGVRVLVFDGPAAARISRQVVAHLAREQYLSLMIEAGSKVNWAALESGVVDKVFFYYAPKILGGLQSLPVAGGTGRLRRTDAILLRGVRLHPIPPDEFAVEAWVEKEAVKCSPASSRRWERGRCRRAIGCASNAASCSRIPEGASIAVNGVCLTAVEIDPDGFWCDLSPETLAALIWARCAKARG